MGTRFIVDQFTEQQWEAMADEFRLANLYQSWQYGQFHSQGIGRRVARVAVLDGERPLAMAQVSLKQIPLLGAGVAEIAWGPLFHPEGEFEQPLADLLQNARDIFTVRKGLQFRISPRSTLAPETDAKIATVMEAAGFHRSAGIRAYKTVILDLSQELPAIRKRFDQKWRNQLNVSERSGLKLETGDTAEHFERFYVLYQEMWAAKRFPTGVRVPLVRLMHRELPIERRLKITIATDQGRDAGATVCAVCGDTLLYYLGATSPNLRKDCRPGYQLQWSHIVHAKSRGLRWYDAGGIPDDEGASDISRFKTRMNGAIVSFPGRFDCEGRDRKIYALAEQTFRRARRLFTGR